MGRYDQWAGDVEDYTDEEVADFSVTAVGRAHVEEMYSAWLWLRELKATDAAERRALAHMAGKSGRPGQLRTLAESLFMVVTAPGDGEAVAALEPWELEELFEPEIVPVPDAFRTQIALVERHMRLVATMMRALPRYNKRVKSSLFPEGMWSKQVKHMCNRVLLRFEKELYEWNFSLSIINDV